MSDLLIRPVVRADFDRWHGLWDGYNAFYGRAGPTALADEITEQTWLRFLDPAVPMSALVAEDGGQLVGLAHYLFHLSTISTSSTCYLQDLFTHERARGRGVARSLVERVFQEAAAAGAARVYWQTRESNLAARTLYDRLAERSDFIIYRRSL